MFTPKLTRSLRAVRSFLAPVLHDRRGAAAVFLAVALIPMVGAVGLAIDSSRGYLLKTRMGKALDTAGLAAGRVALDGNAQDVAQQFFDANFGTSDASVEVAPVAFALDDTMRFVTLSTTATTPTLFMRVFGRETMIVSARSVIQRETTGMELALVMDNTGSMWPDEFSTLTGTPFKAMQDAADDLIDILYGSDSEIENLWVSLVPYTAMVNIGKTRTDWLKSGDRVLNNPGSYSTVGWKGCVMARTYPNDTNDAPPSVEKFGSFFYASTNSDSNDNKWPTIKEDYTYKNGARGPNLGCGPAITPLTKSKATIKAAIADMKPWSRGGTTGNLGLSWGWRTLSPQWRGLWGDPDLPLDYGTPFMDKVAVILTDGQNQFHDNSNDSKNDKEVPASDYTAYGRIEDLVGYSTGKEDARRSDGRAILDARMTETCNAMKAAGIRIYTITFNKPDATAKALFKKCATTEAMYWHAPDNDTLSAVFRAIGGQLANLRIVE